MVSSISSPQTLVVTALPARHERLLAMMAQEGFQVATAPTGEVALARLHGLASGSALDLLLIAAEPAPRKALDVLVRVRGCSLLPVVLLGSAQAGDGERLAALRIGADDYMDAAMPVREVLARLRALLRRVAWCSVPAQPAATPSDILAAPHLPGGWRLVRESRSLVGRAEDEAIPLTSAEFELLRLLIAAQGEPVDREAILRGVFRRPWRAEDRAVDGLVKRLRRKLPADAIASVRGIGYALCCAEPLEAAPPRRRAAATPAFAAAYAELGLPGDGEA